MLKFFICIDICEHLHSLFVTLQTPEDVVGLFLRKCVAVRTPHDLVLTVLVMLGREANDGCDKCRCLSDCLPVLFGIRTRSSLFNAIDLNWVPQLPLARML